MAAESLGLAAGLLTLGVVGWRIDGLIRSFMASRRAVEERTLSLRERELLLAERRAEGSEEMPALPLDLQARVNRETEPWAREQVSSLVQQLWRKHRAWDPVRHEMSTADAHAVISELGWSQITGVVS